MNDDYNYNTTVDHLSEFFGSLPLLILLILFFIWFAIAVLAGVVAPRDREWTFFWLTLLFFGVFGVALAVVANERAPGPRRLPPGYRAVYCTRCDARNQFSRESAGYTCWQCDEEHSVTPKKSDRSFLSYFW